MACCVLIASVIAALLTLVRVGRNPADDPRAWRLKVWRLTKDTSHD